MNLHPTLDRVIIRADAKNESSTIIIPPKFKEFMDRGTIVAVGPGRRHIDGTVYAPALNPGDRVIFIIAKAILFSDDGTDLLAVNAEDVLCVLKPEESVAGN